MNIRMMEYSTCVSFTGLPFFSSVRLRVFSRKGGWLISPERSSMLPPLRRMRASTRAVSSAGEKGLVT